jgi:serine/threonine-protein kinase
MRASEWTIGNYVVDDPTGFARGTFGTLYVARRMDDGAKVAMKLVLLTNASDGRERLEAERHGAILQQQFEQAHGMVPEVYEYGPHREHLYIAMEFVEGQALSERIKTGLAPGDAARHAAGICEFLEKAHQFATTVEGLPYDRIVHADLKPDHVLIAQSGEMKVLDFGIAKALEKTTETPRIRTGSSRRQSRPTRSPTSSGTTSSVARCGMGGIRGSTSCFPPPGVPTPASR